MKNKQNFKILYFLLLFLINYSCTKKTECPGFPDEYLGYAPYEPGQTLVFSNKIDTVHFTVISYKKDDDEIYKSSCGYSCCAARFQFETDYNSRLGFSIKCVNDYIPTHDEIYFSYYFGSYLGIYGFGFEFKNDEFLFSDKENSNILDSIVINNTIYKDVLDMENDTSGLNKPYIWKMLFVKDVGIIKIYDFETKEEWELIP
jgi:hypothetical protein